MKIFTMVLGPLCLVAACGQAGPNGSHPDSVGASTDATILTCQSIDTTFSPFYEVKVRPFDPTFPDSYLVEIQETDVMHHGSGAVSVNKEAHGTIDSTGTGTLAYDGGKLVIARLGNGVLKGTMDLDGSSNVELSCRMSAVIQPVAGVSN